MTNRENHNVNESWDDVGTGPHPERKTPLKPASENPNGPGKMPVGGKSNDDVKLESGKKKKKMEEEMDFEEEEADLDEETLAASTLHPGAKSVSDPKSKIGMMQAVMGQMHQMSKGDLTHWFNATQAQFGPGKTYGVGDNSAQNTSSIDMKTGKGPKTKYPMPKLGMKEDVEEMFNGYDLSEDFKEEASTLFEAAISARLIAETARLEEEFEQKLAEELAVFNEDLTSKIDTYLDYVVENWMKENEVAIESTLRNEIMEEFMDGLKNLFSEHYISVPEDKVDVLEALAEKVTSLEEKLDETISENAALKGTLIEDQARDIFEELASDLALTQQEKFAALAEGIEFDGNLNTYAKKLNIIKENYFHNDSTTYSSNIEEETFEGEISESTRYVDPQVNRYVQAIARNVKK
jgi:hypothetical protein